MKIRNINKKYLAGAALVSMATASQAAIDTTAVTGALTDAGAALAVVGAAYVAMKYGSAVWKWLTSFAR